MKSVAIIFVACSITNPLSFDAVLVAPTVVLLPEDATPTGREIETNELLPTQKTRKCCYIGTVLVQVQPNVV